MGPSFLYCLRFGLLKWWFLVGMFSVEWNLFGVGRCKAVLWWCLFLFGGFMVSVCGWDAWVVLIVVKILFGC